MPNVLTDWVLKLVHGWLAPYPHGENEVELVSTKSDPGALRLAIDADKVEHNLGKVSWNTVRDGTVHDEHALIQGQIYQGPDGGIRSGQGTLEFCTRGAGQESVNQRMLIREDSILCHVPILAPNIGDGSTTTPAANELRAPGGVFWFVIQATDGNLVAYQNSVPFDYSTGVPYWNSGPAPPL